MHVAIIGAGPAGLAAASRLSADGHDVAVVEEQHYPGGLAGTLRMDGFAFDFGGHRLVTRNERVVALARELLGEELLTTTRLSKVFFQGRFWSQPLEVTDALRSVRPGLALRAVLGYVVASAKRMRDEGEQQSFEEWVVARFGRPLYDVFFGPYTEKVWGVDPSLIAAEWAPRRIMVGGLGSLLRALLLPEHRRPATTSRSYLYPRLGCGQLYERLAESCAERGARFVYGSRASAVTVGRDGVTVELEGDGPRELAADALISTAPLPALTAMLRPAVPPEVLSAAGELRYRGIVFVFLRLERSLALGWDALYVPEPDYLFFRAEEPRLWSADLAPEGRTSLCLEIAASPGDGVWQAGDEQLLTRCLQDLTRMGFVITRREVLGYDVVRLPHVYPMQLVGTERARDRCLDHLEPLSPTVQSIGRQGAFRYLDMDESIEMGWWAAGVLTGKARGRPARDLRQERAYLWSPKRQLAGVRGG